MTKPKLLTIIFSIITVACPTFALEISDFKYTADITIQPADQKYCSLLLTPEVYDKANTDLSDIRLIDTVNTQLPYILTRPRDITDTELFSPAMINRTTDDNKNSLLTLDFGKQLMKNSIQVNTQGRNFRRPVKVEGSNDNTAFFTLVDSAYVFAVDTDKKHRFSTIDLPQNDFRYLRVTVSPMPEETETPVIESVKVSRISEQSAPRTQIEIPFVEYIQDEKNKTTHYICDLKYNNLPVTELQLSVADDSFYRYVTVSGRDATTKKILITSEDNRQRYKEVEVPFQYIFSDTVYRFVDTHGKIQQRLKLSQHSDSKMYRYIRITVKNYDDQPLEITSASASMIPHQLIFEKPQNPSFALYLGCASASSPRYDLTRTLNDPLKLQTAKASIVDLADNPAYIAAPEKPLPWTEKHKAIMWTVLIVVMLVLGVVIIKSFKSIQSQQSE